MQLQMLDALLNLMHAQVDIDIIWTNKFCIVAQF
jgi:hypothetical protein